MKKVVRIVGICSRPLQARYMNATPAERAELDPVVEGESAWMIRKMERKGYRLEGTVAGVLGIFTRGAAEGAIRLRQHEDMATSP